MGDEVGLHTVIGLFGFRNMLGGLKGTHGDGFFEAVFPAVEEQVLGTAC